MVKIVSHKMYHIWKCIKAGEVAAVVVGVVIGWYQEDTSMASCTLSSCMDSFNHCLDVLSSTHPLDGQY
ncbi:hypothetical protein MIDIC_500015 [Alphaproteobacteria bacterium]